MQQTLECAQACHLEQLSSLGFFQNPYGLQEQEQSMNMPDLHLQFNNYNPKQAHNTKHEYGLRLQNFTYEDEYDSLLVNDQSPRELFPSCFNFGFDYRKAESEIMDSLLDNSGTNASTKISDEGINPEVLIITPQVAEETKSPAFKITIDTKQEENDISSYKKKQLKNCLPISMFKTDTRGRKYKNHKQIIMKDTNEDFIKEKRSIFRKLKKLICKNPKLQSDLRNEIGEPAFIKVLEQFRASKTIYTQWKPKDKKDKGKKLGNKQKQQHISAVQAVCYQYNKARMESFFKDYNLKAAFVVAVPYLLQDYQTYDPKRDFKVYETIIDHLRQCADIISSSCNRNKD